MRAGTCDDEPIVGPDRWLDHLTAAGPSIIVSHMANLLDEHDADAVFRALAAAPRRIMVERLARGPASVSTLAEPLAMALPTVLQHLAILEDAGIASSQKHGRVRTVQLVPGALDGARSWLAEQRTEAERRADRLTALLDPPTDPTA
jgi:DNA-binding transcriptional ArsR family regulator